MIKKWLFSMSLFTIAFAAPQAVIFDWGNVLATNDRDCVIDFLCDSLSISKDEFETINLEKKEAAKSGKSDIDFWLEYAEKNEINLPSNWPDFYQAILRKSIKIDEDLFTLVFDLKEKGIKVGVLSNIDERYMKMIRGFGFYEPFDPCLLSCEIGKSKPNVDAYNILLDQLKVSAKDVVFIDDKKENVDAAKKLGIDAFVFESADQVKQELAKRGCPTDSN